MACVQTGHKRYSVPTHTHTDCSLFHSHTPQNSKKRFDKAHQKGKIPSQRWCSEGVDSFWKDNHLYLASAHAFGARMFLVLLYKWFYPSNQPGTGFSSINREQKIQPGPWHKHIKDLYNPDSQFIMHIAAFEILFEAPWKLLMVFASLFTTMCLNALNLPPTFVEARPDCRLSKGSLVEL